MDCNKKGISSFSIIILFSCLAMVGVFFIPLLPVKLSPSKNLPEIHIHFSMYGQSAKVVETEVTSKLEGMLSRVKGVEGISSTSGSGFGHLTVRLNKYANIELTRFEISTIIRQAWPSLPQGVSYPTISAQSSNDESKMPFLSYTISAPSTPILIQKFAETQIKPKLSQISGINDININGASPMIWSLKYDYEQLRQLNVSVDDIRNAIRIYLDKDYLGVGKIQDESENGHWIRIVLMPEQNGEDFDISNIIVKNVEEKLIHLDELVEANYIEKEPTGYFRINGLNSIYMSISAKEDVNQINLSKQIQSVLKEMQANFPAGHELHLTYDATEYIKEELNKIYFRSGLTALILLCFVLLIYRNLKYLLLITISLIINILIAVILFYCFRLEIQLYSLAGITISLTLVIDNTIVMSDQIIRRNNKNAFLAILAATLTTIASLSIIFFMDERTRLNLQDFTYVVILNLAVSLFIALFLVPALIEKLRIKVKKRKSKKSDIFGKRYIVSRFNKLYEKIITFLYRKKGWSIAIIILAFGLPVFLLPEKAENQSAEKQGFWDNLYNSTLGSTFYKEKIKPVSDVALGGTLRLFVQKVYEGSYAERDRGETSLHVIASMPNGSTLEQMNVLIQKMENYIKQYPEVRQFQTNVQNGQQANITILFTKEHQRSNFPYILKSKLISKALELGGGSWNVYGIGDGFSNDIKEQAGSYRVKLFGYNYDELYLLAEMFKDTLLQHRRIKEVLIDSEFSWYKNDYQEFIFDLNKEQLTKVNIQPMELFASLNPVLGKNIYAGRANSLNNEAILLNSIQADKFDKWNLINSPNQVNNKSYKLSDVANIEKSQIPQKIAKENQQYRLCLQYEYIGAFQQGQKVLEKNIDNFKQYLPLGYSIQKDGFDYWFWNKKDYQQYWLLVLIIVIIFFMASILLNSLKQPLVVIFIIPISFIGLFLTFYWFNINFDQGGFAAFVMLCGLTVNASIYILNEYNNIRSKRKNITKMKAYIRAWNRKISPIFLTIVSTILGFIPFIVGEHKEAFWFPLAVGTIGGLIMSFIGIFLFMPLFMGVGKSRNELLYKIKG